ncbi:MAG: hypothetical protein RLY20_3047 [Verrucomicrobiota bacterium]
MKTILCLMVIAFGFVAQQAHAQGAAGAIAKQRAKEVVNQNNVRQGIGAPAAPSQPPTAQPGQPQRPDPVAKIKADIAAISGNSAVSVEQKKQLTTDILACARGSKKPALATVEKFSAGLAEAIAGKSVESGAQSRLAADINLAVNSASLPAQRTTEVGDDVQAILQNAGLTRGAAVNVTSHLKAVMTELQTAK